MALIVDTFNRTNEAPLATPWVLENATTNLHDNTAATGGTLRSVAHYSSISFPNDQYAQVLSKNMPSYPAFNTNGGLQGLGPAVRVSYTPTLQAYYVACLRGRISIVKQSHVTRVVLIESFPVLSSMPAECNIRLNVEGPSSFTELEVIVDGTVMVGVVDTTGFATGAAGFFVGHVDTPVLLQVDAWKAGEFAEAYSADYPEPPPPVIDRVPKYLRSYGRGITQVHLP